ncbi:hypothetical protein LguiB_021638 [Lonicera macranthoides]
MTRKKVKLAYITNDASRKATFKKRKKGLMKKVSELSTLCGIDACAIIYSPFDASQPEVWPNIMGAQRVLGQFKKMPEMEQYKKMMNQESFIRQRIAKASETLKKEHKENREKEMTHVMYQCLMGTGFQGLSMTDLNDVGWLVDKKIKEIQIRIESLKKAAHSKIAPPPTVGASPPVTAARPPKAGAPPVVAASAETREVVDFLSMDGTQRPQLFMELLNTPNEQVGFGHGDNEMMMPYGDNYHNAMWSSAFFP